MRREVRSHASLRTQLPCSKARHPLSLRNICAFCFSGLVTLTQRSTVHLPGIQTEAPHAHTLILLLCSPNHSCGRRAGLEGQGVCRRGEGRAGHPLYGREGASSQVEDPRGGSKAHWELRLQEERQRGWAGGGVKKENHERMRGKYQKGQAALARSGEKGFPKATH